MALFIDIRVSSPSAQFMLIHYATVWIIQI